VHALIAGSGFLRAWLLVAGPMFQAAVQLDAGEPERDWLAAAAGRSGPQRRSSRWWWLLPPVAYILPRRPQRNHRERLVDAVSHDDVETFVELTNVSTA
jgi:hypothetical protein